jgi:DNA polymerase-1
MILQVHDELIFDVDPEELEQMKELVKEQMENAVSLTVKLKVQIGLGKNWYDLK